MIKINLDSCSNDPRSVETRETIENVFHPPAVVTSGMVVSF